jgi:hypothetical protein
MGFLPTATPELLQIMKNCLSFMVFTCDFVILFVEVILATPLIDASKFAILGDKLFLFILFLCSFF